MLINAVGTKTEIKHTVNQSMFNVYKICLNAPLNEYIWSIHIEFKNIKRI